MGNHFYGSYHWELCPVEDRISLLDALEVFSDGETNLFIETINPSIIQRLRFWRMRSSYRTDLLPDALSPPPAIFHLALTPANLAALKRMVGRDGLDEKSITHIKGYSGNQGLFWFHGFCDEGDQPLACSRYVDDSTIGKLEAKLHVKAEKKFGELKSDRERTEELEQFLNAMGRYRADSK